MVSETPDRADGPDDFFVEAVGELRRLAAQLLADERTNHTLQPTALVNELYLRMAGGRLSGWESRAGFFAFAAKAMRWILVDHARRRGRAKRQLFEAGEPLLVAGEAPLSTAELIDLDVALDELGRIHERQARVVELHYFMGLSFAEIASGLDLGLATVHRDWAAARAWLFRALADRPPGAASSAQSEAGQ
jgi:RNA polymerase sigma factor (TIGR02999 family)